MDKLDKMRNSLEKNLPTKTPSADLMDVCNT